MDRQSNKTKIGDRNLSQDDSQGKQRDNIHGNIYQLKLLMLFWYGGIENERPFRLSTEVEECKKFDDLMFEYTERGEKLFRLLQAKHRKDQTKTISASDLLTESDSDFSLIKYFFSYQDLKLEKIFQDGTIKDVIICTNIDFDIDDLQRTGISVTEIKEADNIFDIINVGNKKCVRYKFLNIPSLKPKLKNYHLAKLARELLNCMLDNKPIQHHQKDSIFYNYHLALAKEIVNVKSKNFHNNFINNKNLSSEAKKFRDAFEKELLTKTQSKITLKNLNEAMAGTANLNQTFYMPLSKKFGQREEEKKEKKKKKEKKGKKGEEEEKKGEDSQKWPEDVINDEDIDDYLNHLVFAVNQPNEEELGNIMKDKIRREHNYITTQYLYDKAYHEMLNLLQGRKGIRFLTDERGKKIIEIGKKEIFSVPSLQFEDQLRSLHGNIRFRKLDKLREFISSEYYIWILYSSTPWLRSLMLYGALNEDYKNLKHLFVPSSYVQENVDMIRYFEDIDLWIAVSLLSEDADSKKIQSIVSTFQEMFESCASSKDQRTKRLIYITPNHDLTQICAQNYDNNYDKELGITFSDFKSESQDFISEVKIIRFQGKVEKQSIKDLLYISNNPFTFRKEMELINLESDDFEMLLKNSPVDIWKDRPRFSDFESVYYKPYKELKPHQVKEAIERNRNDIFAFEGNEDEIKLLFLSEQRVLNKFKEVSTASSENILHFIRLEEDKSEEQFKMLCHLIDERYANVESKVSTIHLLRGTENGWMWIQSYNRNIYVQRYFLNKSDDAVKKLLVENERHLNRLIIISGITKENLARTLNINSRYLSEQNTFVSKNHDAALSYFREKRECEKYDSIFWFARKKGSFHTQNSYPYPPKAHSSEMHELIYKTANDVSSENDLMNSKRQVIVLAGESGVGKSFTMAHIADAVKTANPSFLVIKIELQKFKKMLLSVSFETLTDVAGLLQLFDIKGGKNSLSKKLLRYMLLHTNRVKIFWDGFDELSPKQQDNVLQIFKTIQRETSASMWITTRYECQEKLEEELDVSAHTFSRINDNDQASILTQFWDTALKFSYKCETESFRASIAKHAGEIMTYFDCKLVNVSNLQHIPLIMRMMAEMRLESLQTIGSTTNSDNATNFSVVENYFHIVDMYHAFVDKKYDIYLSEKSNVGSLDTESISALKRQYTKAYGCLAVKVICNKLCNTKDCICDMKELFSLDILSKIGLVEGPVEPANFMHRTFAEYFATEEIGDMLKLTPSSLSSMHLWDIILNEIITSPSGGIFFDYKLNKDRELQNLLAYDKQKEIIYSLILEQSRNVYSVLWYAGLYGLESTLNFFLKSAENFDSLKEISMNLFENVLTLNDYTHYKLLIKSILNYAKVLNSTRIAEFNIPGKSNLLFLASVVGDFETVHMLIDCMQDSNEIVELITSGACFENDGKTALHVALENSNIDIVQKCIEKLNDTQRSKVLNMRDSRNKLPADYAMGKIKGIFYSRYRRYFEIPPRMHGDSLYQEERIPHRLVSSCNASKIMRYKY